MKCLSVASARLFAFHLNKGV